MGDLVSEYGDFIIMSVMGLGVIYALMNIMNLLLGGGWAV